MEPKTKILLGASAFLLVVLIVLYVKYGKTESKDTYINNQIKYSYSTPYKESYKESHEIRENFPQTSPINVLYTDQNGNLGATSDVGINNLSVQTNTTLNSLSAIDTSLNSLNVRGNSSLNSNVSVGGSLTVKNRDILSEIDSLKQILTNITNDGYGNINVKGNITSKQLNTDEAILKTIKLGVNDSNRTFYRYNDSLSNDTLYLDGMPVQIVSCGDTRRGIHTGCNFVNAIS